MLAWPNLEEQGILCLLAEGALCSAERVEKLVTDLLADAQALINGWHSGTGLERFEDEFQSYWNHWPPNTGKFVSLCATDGPTRWVCAFFERNFIIVADNEQALKSWVANYFTPDSKVIFQPIPLIRLPRPPRPEEYPNSVSDLYSLLKSDTEALTMLQRLIQENQDKSKGVLLSFAGRRGSGFAGLILPRNKKEIYNGFRKGRMSHDVLMQRFGAYPVKCATVVRCDSSWVHGRDSNPDVVSLGKKTVIILGVGSLGSGIAELMAKMGTGKLVLIDPDDMAAENAGRHTLGVRSMFRKKAAEQVHILSKRFPHLQFEAICERWENRYRNNPSIFNSSDLIISTIGVWATESALNAVAYTSEKIPPVLFGWLEEHASVGHAVVFYGEKGCLRCMTDDMGHPRLPVTKWPNGGTQRLIPMCGGMFQPYGATELSFAHGLVSDLAADILLGRTKFSTHHTWIGQKKLLEQSKGEWNPDWIAQHGNPGDGGKIVILPILTDECCPICGESQ
jgi:molybdopterin/thiamine biosynthesis adenylyltransferase